MELKDNELKKNYWRYIIPSIVAQVVFTVYTMVDGLMVGRGVSAEALAGVNIASPFVSLLWAISITFAVGTSTIIARLMGEGKRDKADEVFTQTIVSLIVISIVFSAVSFFGAEYIAGFLGATENTREYVLTYIKTIAPYAAFFTTAYICEISLPIDGHPKMATFTVIIGVVTNCVLDYLFIFVWGKGVWGAAFATALAQVVSVAIYAVHFLGPRSNLKLVKFNYNSKLLLMEIYRGIPSGAMEISPGLATWIFVQVIGRVIGEKGLVAYSTMGYVAAVMIIVAVGIGQGSQPLISYYNGARRPEMIRKIRNMELRDVFVISIIMFSAVFLMARRIVTLFIPDESPEMLMYTTDAFRLFISFCLVDVYNIVLSMFTTALEKPIPAVVTSMCRTTLFLVAGIGIMYFLLGEKGIWLGLTASEVMTLALNLGIYYKNHGFLSELEINDK